MKQIIYNLKHLIAIEVHDKYECTDFIYKRYKNTFWKTTQEGFYVNVYNCSGNIRYSKEDLENKKYYDTDLIVEDTTVYYWPYVRLRFNDNITFIKRFKTIDEVLEYAENISNKIKNKLTIDSFK
jgi:hypothetical protein